MAKHFWEDKDAPDIEDDLGMAQGYYGVEPERIAKMETLQVLIAMESETIGSVKHAYLQNELQMRIVKAQNAATYKVAALSAGMVIVGILVERYLL